MPVSESIPIQPGNWDHLNDYLSAIVPVATYTIKSDGSTVTALDSRNSRVVSGTDGGAVLTSVLALLPATGGRIVFSNDGNAFPWATMPLLPKNVTRKLLIDGNGCTLATTGVPGFGFNRTADYDTFQNIELRNFNFDATSLTVSANTHAFVGPYSGGSLQARLNFDRITVRNIRVLNMPAAGAGQTFGVMFASAHAAAGETQTNITNILIEDIDIAGTDVGVSVIGTGGSTNVNVFIDQVRIQRIRHDASTSGTAPTAFRACTNVHVGSRGFGGTCTVRDVYGANSGDDGIEINAMTTADVEECLIVDAWNANYVHTNFRAPQFANAQRVTFRRCESRQVNQATNTTPLGGWYCPINQSTALGQIDLIDCSFYKSANIVGNNAGEIFNMTATPNWQKITIKGLRAVTESFNYTAAGAVSPISLNIPAATSGSRFLEISDCYISYSGQRSGGSPGTVTWTGCLMNGNYDFLVEDVAFNYAVTTSTVNTRHFDVGSSTSTMSGIFRNIQTQAYTDDTGPRGFIIRGTATLTITKSIRIENCDWTAMPAGVTEILYAGTSNAASTFVRGNRWKNQPAPTTLTGLVTATGKALATGWAATATVRQGTGAAITAIDFSTNGGANFTNFLTQASAAIPAGFDQSMGVLTTDAQIKATFTTTQPTIDLTPFDP